MSKKLFVAPNHHLLSFAQKAIGEEISESIIKAGYLHAEYDWQDIDDEDDISTEDLISLITAGSAGSPCVYAIKENTDTHQLLLPPVSAWIMLINEQQSCPVESAVNNWLEYIDCAKQLLLLFPGQVVATWPQALQNSSVIEQQLQLILAQDPRIAMATQEWQSFVVSSGNEPSAIALASELLIQKQTQAESDKSNFQAKATLKQEISDLSNELAKVCAERNTLAELEPQLNAKRAELEQSQQSIATLQEKLSQSQVAHQQVSEALNTKEAQHDVLAKEVEQLKASLSQHEELKAVLEKTQTHLTDLQEEYQSASQEKLQLVSRLETNRKQLEEMTSQLEAANAQISQLQKETKELAASKQITDSALQQTENKVAELAAQLKASTDEAAEQKNELALATLQVAQLQQELEQLTQDKKDLETALQQSTEQEKATASQLNEKSNALTQANDELELGVLQVTQLQQELEQLTQDKKDLEVALQQSTEQEKAIAAQLNEQSNALTQANDELELSVLQLSQLQEELESVSAREQTLQTASQSAKADAERANLAAIESATKYSETCAELELANLQLSQLQEELEQVFTKEQAAAKALNDTATACAAAQQKADAVTAELTQSKQESELLTLQLSQLQEELEHYFVAYQKLKAESVKAADETEQYWHNAIKARTDTFLVAQKVQVTGGFDNDTVHRLVTRLNQVTNLKTKWDAFSVMFNDRNGNLDIEFHAPAENRVYPLSEFVKTGSSKVCDYSIIKPFEGLNCTVLSVLSDDDKSLLMEIIKEVCIHLQNNACDVLKQAEQVDTQAWLPKLEQMLEALHSPDSMTTFLEELLTESVEAIDVEQKAKELEEEPTAITTTLVSEQTIPAPTGIPQGADGVSFTKLTLIQNMVAETNQHLSIRADNLSYAERSFDQFEFKIGAKRIEKETFTQFGSIELREQQGVAPISDWRIAAEDKWGKKLVLSLGPIITAAEKQNITSLNSQDQAFVRAFLSALIKHIHKLDLSDIELANPLSDWHAMLISMLEQFNQTAPQPAEKGE